MYGGCWVYEPPAFASLRVPLLLTQKGEGGSQTRPYRLPQNGETLRPATPGIPRSRHFVCSRPCCRSFGLRERGLWLWLVASRRSYCAGPCSNGHHSAVYVDVGAGHEGGFFGG